MRITGIILILCISTFNAVAQETFPKNDVKDERISAFAITGANIVSKPGEIIEKGVILIKNDKIVSVGSGITVPEGYIEVNAKGKYIYPAFIDIYTSYGVPKPERKSSSSRSEQIQSAKSGAYNANEAIKAENNGADFFSVDRKEAEALRKMGFGTILTHHDDGIARGTSAIVTLGEDNENEVMLEPRAAFHYSFNKGTSTQMYPSSRMGYIALLRQTYLDGEWFEAQDPRPFSDISLEAFLEGQSLPQIFETSNWREVLRADKLGGEFDKDYIIITGGNDYQRVKEIKNTGSKLVLPLNFPEAFDVDDPIDAELVSLDDMKHWEMAPANPAIISENDIDFALTTYKSDKKSFIKNLRKAVKYGLSKEDALKALTEAPAKFVNIYDRVGSLESGKLANFIITDEDIFEDKSKILQNWIQGKKYEIEPLIEDDIDGNYELKVEESLYSLEITGSAKKPKGKISLNDSSSIKVDISYSQGEINIAFDGDTSKVDDRLTRLSGWKEGRDFRGTGKNRTGQWVKWSAKWESSIEKKNSSEKEKKEAEMGIPDQVITYPFTAYGFKELPSQETILIKNATIWTNEEEGILKGYDLLLKDGKINKIGKGIKSRADRVIDATGKHVTAGIIDEHSHIAADAINDVATNSSMVRIGDVIDSEDISIYRSLAGGVTALQILHGSANPIGGQSALIKLRWGDSPEDLKIKNADGFIKFALGENVKRSWNSSSQRYPQTRMGVEQVYRDAFSSALDYRKKWKAYNALSASEKTESIKPRKDLAMETMLEIIDSKRFISCHSYVQSEINMLMKVAEDYDFRINTFTHILEGYKVADKMKDHGAGGSTFSDWWNYKWEVRYAIPYNATIMNREGVVTAINSDSNEMIRRLNQEAAKMVKYGGTSEEDALKMVTLNPAKLLHLDDRMGSIKKGKDADVVVWSDHPLSIYAKAEKTIIDGKIYFDIERDKLLRKEIESERNRLIQKMKDVKANGGKAVKATSSEKMEFDCEDVLGVVSHENKIKK